MVGDQRYLLTGRSPEQRITLVFLQDRTKNYGHCTMLRPFLALLPYLEPKKIVNELGKSHSSPNLRDLITCMRDANVYLHISRELTNLMFWHTGSELRVTRLN